MKLDKAIDGFLADYLQAYKEAKFVDRASTLRRLCEEYDYGSNNDGSNRNRELLMLAMGWIWAKSSYVEGNCYTAILMKELDEMYAVVAKENHWEK
jgi:hypothetical protein